MTSSGGVLGNGNWYLDRYWLEKHGSAVPVALDGATRYQTYLYELGESFARRGRETQYPVSDPTPAGFEIVVPAGPEVPAQPSQAQSPAHAGRPPPHVPSHWLAERERGVSEKRWCRG